MNNRILLLIIGVLVVTLGFVLLKTNTQTSPSIKQSTFDSIKEKKVMRVGYAPYPPYIDKDLKTGKLSGYSVDIVNEMADRMGVKVQWFEGSWQTYVADLQTGKFDMFPLVFTTIPRLMQVDFSSPIGYFGGVAALVKSDDTRFTTINDLNKEGITIAVPQGWLAHEYAKKYLSKAKIKPFPEEGAQKALVDVVTDYSDVSLADGPTVQQYIEKNPDQDVKALFLDNPPVVVPAGFAIRKNDFEWETFLNQSIAVLRTDSTLKKLAEKYRLYSFEPETKYVPQ